MSLDTVDIDSPAMGFDRPPRDGQPEAGSTEVTRSGLVDSVEPIEDPITLVWRYARAVVDDPDGRAGPPFRPTFRPFPPAGVYFTALSTRLIRAWRVTRRSTHATTGPVASTVSDWCFSSASTPRCPATS